jgi:TRAP-type mannitol/chloroaromatic compound transport system permease large subunit
VSTLSIGLLYGASTLLVMFAGMPIAFALGAVATVFMICFMPASSVDTISQNVYEEMASITLLSIPLFILKGSAIGRRFMCGCIAFPAVSESQTCSPARCSRRWPAPRLPPAPL